jgi:hypothetical protein
MPEVLLCRYCKRSINMDADPYVVLRQAGDRYQEMLAHAECEQSHPTSFHLEEWLRGFLAGIAHEPQNDSTIPCFGCTPLVMGLNRGTCLPIFAPGVISPASRAFKTPSMMLYRRAVAMPLSMWRWPSGL